MGDENERAAVAWARGHEAVNIKDPAARRAFIARQGNEEAIERLAAPYIGKRAAGRSFEKIARESISNFDEARRRRRLLRSRRARTSR